MMGWEYNNRLSYLQDLMFQFEELHAWYLGWRTRKEAGEEKKQEPEPVRKIEVIKEIPRGYIY